jgi:hypothetical protein
MVIDDQFFGVVTLLSDGLTGLQSFLLQPIDGHVFIPSGCFPPEACFIFSENEMSGRHVLHGSQTMQVYHCLRRQCTLFMVNHAGHADRTFRSPKR